ncbi:zinc finger protein 185 isoform X3 [Hippocampus zosterae]|uniref:zinc finger protein 185 isoform X3 n=1 Tax=Hippocampus zosterae TaxID=109293 RepID=UPI00223E2BFA|nr:zinc finger protein 185 isoform X3 [Hippocampus zosterae]
MSTEGEKSTVFRTTKVRTKLKGDLSWMNRNNDAEDEPAEEKPWMAEIRARRQNGASSSPVSSPTSSAPKAHTKSDSEKSPSSGFMIRGVFNKPASSSTTTSNGISGTSKVTKTHSEGYKKIAPHTVKPSTEELDSKISSEEQLKRTAAASKVLDRSAPRQRSYVLSAAKKFEAQAAENSETKESPSFVAKRVEIEDDASVSPVLPSPVIPITSVASVPKAAKTEAIVSSSVKTTVVTVNEPPKVEVAPPEPVKEDPPRMSAVNKESLEDMKPDCTKVAAPLPELITDYLHVVSTHSEHNDSEAPDTHLVTINEEPELLENSSSRVETLTAMYENLIPNDSNSTSLRDDEPGLAKEEEGSADAYSEEGKEQYPDPVLSNHEARTEDLLNLTSGQNESEEPAPLSPVRWSEDMHTEFESQEEPETPAPPNSVRWSEDLHTEIKSLEEPEAPAPPSPVRWSEDQHTEFESQEELEKPDPPSPVRWSEDLNTEFKSQKEPKEPTPPSSVRWSEDLHTEIESQEEPEQPAPRSSVRWSEDLHTEIESQEEPEEPEPAPPSSVRWSEDLHTKFESQEEPEEPAPSNSVHWSEDLHTEFESNTETVTITSQTVTITENREERDLLSSRVTTTVTELSSTDPFDPYPIGTTSRNSSSDLLQPLSDISISRYSSPHTFMERKDPEISLKSQILESLAEDVIPIDTTATSLSTHRSWARTWETTTPLQTTTEESQEGPRAGQREEQQTLVTFERKSKENDSPWDRWTSPSAYTIPHATEEEAEEESLQDSRMHTVTTITTIRETYGEQEGLSMDRTVLVEAPRTPTPEPDTKKPFVYVKEYVDTSEMSSHNATGSLNSSFSSPCTYCGQMVGNDAKITIEHLNINCHPHCFKCSSCWKPMGDLIDNMFLHGGKVHCESCYSAAFD